MRADLTDITLVVDRSGSMAAIREDAEGGVNTLIAEQAKQPGECLITLVQFDQKYEFVQRGISARQCPPYKLRPRGMTALLDAVGRAINETGARLAALPESDRPGLVVFVISTDGQENASREFTREQVKQMIAHQQTVYNWQFTFLAANAEAFAEAGGMGIATEHAAQFAPGKVRHANLATAQKVARMRKQKADGVDVQNLFTVEERQSME
ncbi:MAG: VWA domain-containing protein [Planctomycetota bacterium]|jgi:Mg-chelatase subunit ChlD